MIDFEQFKNAVPYPERPSKPVLPAHPTSADYRKHADALEKYAEALWANKRAAGAYYDEQARVDAYAKEAMLVEAGLDKHPKRDKIYNYAWQQGHSGGYSEVWNVLNDIADLFKD